MIPPFFLTNIFEKTLRALPYWDAGQLEQPIDILRRRWEGDLDAWEALLRHDGDLCLLKMRGELVECYTVFRLLVTAEFRHASIMQFVCGYLH